MIICLCNGRRIQASLKVIACLLSAIFYFAFLFRESLNAYERKKGKFEQAAIAAGLIQQPEKVEVSQGTEINNIQSRLYSVFLLDSTAYKKSTQQLSYTCPNDHTESRV